VVRLAEVHVLLGPAAAAAPEPGQRLRRRTAGAARSTAEATRMETSRRKPELPIVGIDLGTTNSLIGWADGRPCIARRPPSIRCRCH
jgi:hypothetical protein